MMAALAYLLLQYTIIREQGSDSLLAQAIGSDIKGKISPILYAVAIVVSGFQPWISACIYVGVALTWLVPDRRIEKKIGQTEKTD